MTLTLLADDKDHRGRRSSAWFRTADGRFDVLGVDLNCTDAAARAAGAGPVWSWRPARQTRDYRGDESRAFVSKAACLADLEQHITQAAARNAAIANSKDTIVACRACGQKNRVLAGMHARARCGRCKEAL